MVEPNDWENDIAEALEKALTGDRSDALKAIASALASIATGHPLVGTLLGAVVARSLAHGPEERMLAAGKDVDEHRANARNIAREVVASIRPIWAIEASNLSEQACEQLLQMILFMHRNLAAKTDLEALQKDLWAVRKFVEEQFTAAPPALPSWSSRSGPDALNTWLDSALGPGNWFAYPDNNPLEVGVTRLPRGFRVEAPVKEVHNDLAKTKQGQVNPGGVGSNLLLEAAPKEPTWQEQALREWRAARNKDAVGITRQRVDDIFGTHNWRRHRRFAFSAEGVPEKPVAMQYPLTSVDWNNLKFGLGTIVVISPGSRTRIWVAGDIRGT